MLNLLKSLRGKNLKAKLLHPKDTYYDHLLRVETFGYKQVDQYDLQNPTCKFDYMPTSYQEVFTLAKEANINADSVVVDFGSGLGRVVFATAYLGAKHSIGVEFDEELHNAAELNKRHSKFADKVSFVHQDATLYAIPPNANVFFFYNPFGSAIMSTVIERIEASVEAHPRKVAIIYFNARFPEALKVSRQFKLAKEWLENEKRYSAQIWRN
ncbi:MAG TPA: 50S ribosomal protein L11 methyltransferase [Methylotenera sp.]|nr:50S ribosomal protein L11 methyltransferase [Methylotenera sp.]HPH06510.1 50S ribosomal protein L11 methyltransferase [Methylotenera sp.]HPN02001.1 50S ribosomal protein L11 methyltransferase [Methylotenera sp.]